MAFLILWNGKLYTFFRKGCEAPASASIDAYGLIYYFIQQRSDKVHTSENPKPPMKTF
jgi:hypothetical protein